MTIFLVLVGLTGMVGLIVYANERVETPDATAGVMTTGCIWGIACLIMAGNAAGL